MSLARRLPEPVLGVLPERPALSPLGVPELRTQRSALRARRRARKLTVIRLVIYGCCFVTGVLAGLLTAQGLSLRQARPASGASLAGTPERVVVTIRTLPH